MKINILNSNFTNKYGYIWHYKIIKKILYYQCDSYTMIEDENFYNRILNKIWKVRK